MYKIKQTTIITQTYIHCDFHITPHVFNSIQNHHKIIMSSLQKHMTSELWDCSTGMMPQFWLTIPMILLYFHEVCGTKMQNNYEQTLHIYTNRT